MFSPADISSAVWGGHNRALESLTFHPKVLRSDPSAPVSLDRKSRGEIYGLDESEYLELWHCAKQC